MTGTGRAAAAWYPDPLGRHHHRYWDGEQWTAHVADDGVPAIEGAQQQPQPQQPVTQEPHAATPHLQPEPTRGWTEVPARPTPTPTYDWPGSTASSGWPVAVPATATATPAPSSPARIWAVAIAVIVAIAGVGATAVIALGRSDDNGLSASSGQHYPAIVEMNFTHGCTSTGAAADYCRCALTKLEANYDLGEVEDMEKSYVSTGKLPDAMVSIVRECASQQFTAPT